MNKVLDYALDFVPVVMGSALLWSGYRGFQNSITCKYKSLYHQVL
jgi:hypothetical protein